MFEVLVSTTEKKSQKKIIFYKKMNARPLENK